MKKLVIIIVALVGVGGLIALLANRPTPSARSTKSAKAVAGASTTPQPASYKDGTYQGEVVSTIYGPVQVSAIISGGKLTDITWQHTPDDREHSIEISHRADPQLVQEAVSAQSAQVDIISGATQTSEGFTKSLKTALAQAQS